ncbi:hypothetical protein WS67_22745 [Burkholderia singularis]|uniref:Uncharacterized protein n=1 Tax=Burkholderia singularis TaxID=1503053 RepID=A0A103DVJ3_9BURK|nr:hypothetical protein WS67_22745 [Burkholderia singularis]
MLPRSVRRRPIPALRDTALFAAHGVRRAVSRSAIRATCDAPPDLPGRQTLFAVPARAARAPFAIAL